MHAATGQTWHAASVVAATDSFGSLHVPTLPGREQFAMWLQHVASYRSPHHHAGERIVVVGAAAA